MGPNGAGKSTTLNILIGQLCPTTGRVDILGSNVTTQYDRLLGKLGFCPQFDALMDTMTATEHIWFYGMIKCLRDDELPFIARTLTDALGLDTNRDQLTKGYSGGNKRKLSAA